MKSRLSLLSLSLLCLSASMALAQIPVDSIPPLVDSLIQVSRAQTSDAKFDNAFATNKLAGAAAQTCCGGNSAAYAAYCFNEGRIHYFIGQNKEALPWYIQSRALRGEILGTDHIEYSKSCNNLAIAYDVMGRYEEAEPLYLEALAIREATAGRQSTSTAKVLGNLGNLYREMGEYERSEQLITEATNIRKAVSGENSIDYAISLMLLGGQKDDNRNYEDAQALFLQAKEIIENQDRIQYYYYLQALEYLAGIYSSLEDYATAKEYLIEVAEIIEGGYGKEHYRYARCLNSLAALAFQDGKMDESKALLEEQIGLLKQLGYQQTRAYGIALQDLSRISSRQGAPQQALQYMDSALVILEQNISPYSQAYRFALWEYAAIQQSLEQYAIAASTLRRIAVLEEKTLEVATKSLPERDLELYTLEYLGFLSRSMELAKDYPQIADLCYDKILFYKGFLLDHALTLRRYAQQDEQTKSLYKRLRGTNRELTQLYTNTEADADRVSELEILAEQLEQELARAQPKNYEQSFDLSWRDIQQRLTPSEASLEIAASIEYSETGEAVDYNYAGIMVLPEVDFPIYFPLCSQTDFDSVFTVKTSSEDAINNLYQWDGQGQQLYQLIWQPIAEYLENYPAIKRIYFSNDGTFHRINIGALPTSERQVVGQQYELIQLTTTRGLLAEKARQMASGKSAVLFGGISYGNLDESTANTAPTMENEDSGTSTRRRSDTQKIRGYEPANGYWQELPWTEVEINYAQEVLAEAGYAVNMYTGAKATEEQFKSISDDAASPTVVHLATHGYFFAESEDESGQSTLPFAQAKINLIRSGLILADGNYAWVNGSGRSSGPEDGVLTALEVSQLELDETELVILSACETGLGDIRRNEGVYGLQRALKKAGVQYTIISLWQVPDYQAQAFMSSFYLAWLEEGKPIPEAFRNAQAYMRARYKQAFEWAGFILVQ